MATIQPVKVRPLGGPQQLGDVPAPELIGSRGQKLRFLVRRMGQLIAAFAGFAPPFEQAIHGTDRTEIFIFPIQKLHFGYRESLSQGTHTFTPSIPFGMGK